MAKLKSLMPTLRERKRYLAFEVMSEKRIEGRITSVIWRSILENLGVFGCAKAGIWVLPDKYDPEKQRGIIRVNHKHVDELRTTLAMIRSIEGEKVIVRSIGLSGILKKAVSIKEGFECNNQCHIN